MKPMKKLMLGCAVLILSVALMGVATPLQASRSKAVRPMAARPAAVPEVFPAPGEIVAAAPASDWVAIAASDLLVMDLAPGAKGEARRVVIQLMSAPFNQGWVGNIRKLAAAHWWDGTAIVRVQDNYVTQWGDPDGDVAGKAKPLPDALVSVPESEYQTPIDFQAIASLPMGAWFPDPNVTPIGGKDNYSAEIAFSNGWPIALSMAWPKSQKAISKIMQKNSILAWPTHCYGMVGVGRNLSPDTGTGAELYTVIGHAPRHLDRNIALVGRIIEGMEHMSSLPRGTGDLGFYKTPEERTAILSVRLGNEVKGLPAYEYLDTQSKSFAKYADARANRRDPFFIKPAGGADICNIPVPVRRVK
jgi:peptidylprolyl isomerase